MLSNAIFHNIPSCTHTYTHTHVRARAHTRTHTHTHKHTHTHTQTHTHNLIGGNIFVISRNNVKLRQDYQHKLCKT